MEEFNLIMMMLPLPVWAFRTSQFCIRTSSRDHITLKELGIKRVATNPHFEFIKDTDSKFGYFTQLVVVYSRIIMRSKRKGACTDTLLKGFFDRLRTQLEKQEGVEMVESNLDAIVGCVDYFPHMEDQVSCANVPPPDPFLWGWWSQKALPVILMFCFFYLKTLFSIVIILFSCKLFAVFMSYSRWCH